MIHDTVSCMAKFHKEKGSILHKNCQNLKLDYFVVANSMQTCLPDAPFSRSVEFHERVLVLSQADDTHSYHIQFEILPKIVLIYDFLKRNPDVKILVGCDSKDNEYGTNKGLVFMTRSIKVFLTRIGIDSKRLVVHKHVYANELYYPTAGACQVSHIIFRKR